MGKLCRRIASGIQTLALTAVFTAVSCALPANANSVWDAVQSGHLYWSGSGISTNWLSSGDLVITFSDVTADSTLHLPGWTRSWVLAIGGGGAGGAAGTTAIIGMGGGGGAGGFVETNGLMWAVGDYTITVGAGGEAGSGEDSSISLNTKLFEAKGGGVGGNKTNGTAGGSGGGGSMAGTAATQKRTGGVGTSGQGFAGGDGSVVKSAGGGGGAGGVGAESVASSGGNGGLAKTSSITGTEVWYAGGGGGGFYGTKVAYGLGGGTSIEAQKGGGGDGGNYESGEKVTISPVAGTDGLGGGGGGASRNEQGARGGNGVVIIRISMVVDGPIEKPTGGERDYTGSEITIAESIPEVYDVTGQNKATNVGQYTCTATLKDGLKWSDGTTDPVVINWSIVPGHVDMPRPLFESVEYDGENHIAVTVPQLHIQFSGVTCATNVGNYSYSAELDDKTNFRWSDGSTTNLTYNWSIEPSTVEIPQPLIERVIYDGENHIAVEVPQEHVLFSGVICATNVGSYSWTAALESQTNYRWTDGSTTNQTFSWFIDPQKVSPPILPTNLVYSGTNNIAVTPSKFYHYAEGSVTNAIDAGTYTIICQLTDPANYTWADGTITDQTLTWTIARQPIERPPVPGDEGKFIYDGTVHIAATNSLYYTFEFGSTTSARNRREGGYWFEAKLNSNYCWLPDGSTENCVRDWTILQAPNAITVIHLSDWKMGVGPRPGEPNVEATFGRDTATFRYGKSASGPFEWTEPPETNGTFYVQATIPVEVQHQNWAGATAVKRFLIYRNFDEIFTDYVDLNPQSGDQTLTDYVMLVRLSEESYHGFSYERCGDGEGLSFMYDPGGANETPLAYDVDTWDPTGTSLIWVKIPKLIEGKTIRMYWHVKEGMESPGSNVAEVWSNYSGVWHFNEEATATDAAKTIAHDLTGHGYDAAPNQDGKGDVSKMISVPGTIGLGRRICDASNHSGTRLIVSNFTSCALQPGVFFSGWAITGKGEGILTQTFLARKENLTAGGDFAVVFPVNGSSRSRINIYGHGATLSGTSICGDSASGWTQYTVFLSGTNYWVLSQSQNYGFKEGSGSLNEPFGSENLPLAFGGTLNGGTSLLGSLDECRIRPWEGDPNVGPTAAEKAMFFNNFSNVVETTTYLLHDFVVKDGQRQNYWKTQPSILPNEWEEGGQPGIINHGEPAAGEVAVSYHNIFRPEEAMTELPQTAGEYVATFLVHLEGFDDLEVEVPFSIIGHSPYNDLGTTEEGRILLVNDDSRGNWDDPTAITNQAYWRKAVNIEEITTYVITTTQHPVTHKDIIKTNIVHSTLYITNSTFWVHSGDAASTSYTPYLLPNSVHELQTTNHIDSLCGATTLWYLNDVRIGSLYPSDKVESSIRNYLPWSPTSCAISSYGASFTNKNEIGNIVLRNTLNSVDGLKTGIYSPCYTNGIGTIYFDAVNFQANGTDYPGGDSFQLCIEVATNIIGSAKLPTDVNVHEYIETTNELNEVTITTNLYALADWHRIPVVQHEFREGNIHLARPENETITLDMTAGGSTKNFFRIVARINWPVPARFRIRRLTRDEGKTSGTDLDRYGLIALDNIVVSRPSGWAEVKPVGWFDLKKRGKQVLGVENTWSVPFPSISDETIFARALPIYHVEANGTTEGLITKTIMYYRERYLNQRVTEWQPVVLNPYNNFRAMTPLNLSGLVSDIEFYFISSLQTPFYQYTDYSGLNYGVPDYTEEISSVENRCTELREESSPSNGSEWFVRLREGQSDWERLTLRIKGQEPIEMELLANHIWRGYFKTLEPIKGGIDYRIEAHNEQVPDSMIFAVNTNYWFAESSDHIPVSSELQTDGSTNSWANIPCDATTGYLMFQVDDVTKSISIVHADYQDFNKWNDAKKNVFVGNSKEDETKSGVSPRIRDYEENFKFGLGEDEKPWTDTPSGNDNWNEDFEQGASLEYPDYTPFASSTTPGGWLSGPGMYIYQWYRDNTISNAPSPYVARALQMKGSGEGFIQFPLDPYVQPRGIGTMSFEARLGQFIELDEDLSYAEYPEGETDVSRDYTFVAFSAFDTKRNMGFSGNASLSLFAYYRHRRGAYEVRFEQIGATKEGGKVTKPSDKRRLTLYRWQPTAKGGIEAKELGHADYTIKQICTDGLATGTSEYMPFYLSCKTYSNYTMIKFGVLSRYHSKNGTQDVYTQGKGVLFNADIETLSDNHWFYSCTYRDEDASRLKSGTYGVLSANCDGVFLRPYVANAVVSMSVDITKNTLKVNGEGIIHIPADTLKSCRDDLLNEAWNHNTGRMEVFSNEDSQSEWGIKSLAVEQWLALEVSPRGKEQWSVVKRFEFNGFGEAGKSGTPCSCRLDRTQDLDVRLRVEGELSDPRTDVVVDNLKVTQWRGDDYGSDDTWEYRAPNDGYGYRTNFVFSSAWVTNGAVRLSAKRTAGWTTNSKASMIRSPLMDGDGTPERGIGLGLIAFSYRNAQPNAKLLVQIATNDVGSSALGYDTIDDGKWTTVDTLEFKGQPNGQYARYLGMHGVKGLMRICVAPDVVEAVSSTDYLDEANYGEIEITKIHCRDEPPLDLTAWWGWNLKTTDEEARQYLVDNLAFDSDSGLSLALNNSTTDQVQDDPETYKQEMPFVATPAFSENQVGEITFRARIYDANQGKPSEIALYGAKLSATGLVWHCSYTNEPLARFVVSNATYTTYSYKTHVGDGYQAFRLGVPGLLDVKMDSRGKSGRAPGEKQTRVLIDEVLVSEAIYPKLGFRSCWPIRSSLATTDRILTTGQREEQPIFGDAWSVQAEIEPKLLPDELDLDTPGHEPKVFFHWYCGTSPWGYQAWGQLSREEGHRSAELKLAEGEKRVFRGSYLETPSAIVMAEPANATYTYRIYQFAAEVVYYDIKGNCLTNALEQGEWTRPEWYAPLDLNEKYNDGSKDPPFAAYNILESVSPGRAWINEANIFDGRNQSYEYFGVKNQYVEIAVPVAQSIHNWKLYYVDNNDKVNLLCVFGQDAIASSKSVNATNNYAFLTVQNIATKNAKTLDPAKGEVDGTWLKFNASDAKAELDQTHPIGLRLMRPSGILAHEIVLEGTNIWKGSGYEERYSPQKKVERLNETDPEKLWYLAGSECGSTEKTSLGVTNVQVGATRSAIIVPTEMWTNQGRHTPGRVNEGQVIPKNWAIYPTGDMALINATIFGDHIRHTVGDVTNSTLSTIVATAKDGPGTNITYYVDNWYEIAEISENDEVKASGGGNGFVFAAGRDASESMITVRASARPRKDLREKYGLTDSNPYTDAVMHWLNGGKTKKGDFAYPGNIELPKYVDLTDNIVTNLTLTETYWFDIDPTGSNWCWKAGTAVEPKEVYITLPGNVIKTNVRMGVYMVITNKSTVGRQAGLNWSPYVLQGNIPGVDSQMYANGETNRWETVSFKVTGDIQNGKPLRARWVPLRYFVFKEGSFDDHHISTIDIPYPYSNDSLGVNYNWQNFKGCEVWYSWSVDSRVAPVAVEVLCPTNAITR